MYRTIHIQYRVLQNPGYTTTTVLMDEFRYDVSFINSDWIWHDNG